MLWCDLCVWASAGEWLLTVQHFMLEIFPSGLDNVIYGLAEPLRVLTFAFTWLHKVEVNLCLWTYQCYEFLHSVLPEEKTGEPSGHVLAKKTLVLFHNIVPT